MHSQIGMPRPAWGSRAHARLRLLAEGRGRPHRVWEQRRPQRCHGHAALEARSGAVAVPQPAGGGGSIGPRRRWPRHCQPHRRVLANRRLPIHTSAPARAQTDTPAHARTIVACTSNVWLLASTVDHQFRRRVDLLRRPMCSVLVSVECPNERVGGVGGAWCVQVNSSLCLEFVHRLQEDIYSYIRRKFNIDRILSMRLTRRGGARAQKKGSRVNVNPTLDKPTFRFTKTQ